MGRTGVLGPHSTALFHSKAVLLVDNHNSQIIKYYLVFQQRVRTHQNSDATAGKSLQNVASFGGFGSTCQHSDFNSEPLGHTHKCGVVLACQNLGRCHQTRLIAVVGGNKHCGQRNHSLATSHVALQQAVHLLTTHHIATNLLDYALLCSCKFEWKFFAIEAVEKLSHARHRETIGTCRTLCSACHDVELNTKQLVEFESVLCLCKQGCRLWEMYIA